MSALGAGEVHALDLFGCSNITDVRQCPTTYLAGWCVCSLTYKGILLFLAVILYYIYMLLKLTAAHSIVMQVAIGNEA